MELDGIKRFQAQLNKYINKSLTIHELQRIGTNMPYSGVFGAEIDLVYVDLDNIQGAYVSEPGEEPFIAINSLLKDKNEPTAQIVYQALLAFHRALPDVYRLFPIRQFYENLPEVEPEIVIFARPARRWGYAAYYPDDYKMIG
jgi:hypothetical protein